MKKTSPAKARFGKYIGIYLAFILFIISFGMGILFGKSIITNKQIKNENGDIEMSKVLNFNRSLNKSESIDFEQFWTIWDTIKEKYVKQDINDVDLFYGAIQGLVYSLGDPYSIYMVPKVANEFAKDLSGEFEGIGAEIGIKSEQLTIVSPLDNSPAVKAGLRPGDKIMAIDGESTFGIDIGAAVSKIRGPAKSEVILLISRNGLKEAFDVKIIRDTINFPSVTFEWKENNIAYIRILQFNEDTRHIFNQYVDKIVKENVKGVVLDLRNNPGGFLDTAVYMASEWVDDGIIVSEKSEIGNGNEHHTSGKHRLLDIKTVVLVNGGSASASEIVAGALQDYNKATIIGEKTFGKGSVQDFETFSDGSALKLTVAEWYTPNGQNINKEGIMPDIELEQDWTNEEIGEDEMIDKAIDIILEREITKN